MKQVGMVLSPEIQQGVFMAKIVILPEDCKSRASYLSDTALPTFYMSDFTVMGLLVNRYQEALEVLDSSRFSLDKKKGGFDVEVERPSHIQEIQALLSDHGITSEYSDIADTIYQA